MCNIDDKLECNMYTQHWSEINGRKIWHYLICCPVGAIHIITYEKKYGGTERKIILDDNDKAEKLFNKTCKNILDNRE